MILRRNLIILIFGCLAFLGGNLSAFADDDDFNPTNPAEPNVINFCKLTVKADPAEGAYVSGGGRYKVNSGSIYISTSACNTEDYTYNFKYWTLNGEVTSYSQYFYFTPVNGEVELVAHYDKAEVEWDPSNPAEPSSATVKKKYYLYLTSNIAGACSFNTSSGDKIQEGSSLYLCVYPNAYYIFDGWKINGEIVSTEQYFNFTMPNENTTIEACFTEEEYDPESPLDPTSSSQTNVDNTDTTRKFVNLTIGNTDNTAVDKTRIVFNESKSLDYESSCDATKFLSSSADYQIYSLGSDGVKYSINERPTDNGIVPLSIIVKTAGETIITATRLDCTATLVDKTLNVEHDLALGPYTFTANAGTTNGRFELRVPVVYTTGDVNGDGKVSIADIATITDYILGNSPAKFVNAAADVNGDSKISKSDVIGISNIILYGSVNP